LQRQFKILDVRCNFQPTGGGKAAITGDFVITANEVNPVIRALRENGIEVTAIHTHMLSSHACSSFTSGQTTTRRSSRRGSKQR
jgi:hypothetical protein